MLLSSFFIALITLRKIACPPNTQLHDRNCSISLSNKVLLLINVKDFLFCLWEFTCYQRGGQVTH